MLESKRYLSLAALALLSICICVRFPLYEGGLVKNALGIFHIGLNLGGMFLLSFKIKKAHEIIRRELKSTYDLILKKLASSLIFVVKEDQILFNYESDKECFYLRGNGIED